MLPPRYRWTACWSKPTRPILHPFRIAASATNRHLLLRPLATLRSFAGFHPKISAAPPRPISTVCFVAPLLNQALFAHGILHFWHDLGADFSHKGGTDLGLAAQHLGASRAAVKAGDVRQLINREVIRILLGENARELIVGHHLIHDLGHAIGKVLRQDTLLCCLGEHWSHAGIHGFHPLAISVGGI